MNSMSKLPEALSSAPKSRSMGMKLIVVCALAVLMIVPALFVEALLLDRTRRAADVVSEISSDVGGQQTFLGPTLAIPYTTPPESAGDVARHGTYLIFPAKAEATVKTRTEERHRSLFKVPVFQADLHFDAAFDLAGAPAAAPPGSTLDWSNAEIVVGVSDARGALADALLTLNGKISVFAPATVSQRISIGGDQFRSLNLTLFGVPVGNTIKPGSQFNASSTLQFSGAQRLAVLAYGKTTHVAMQSDWPNPGFDGGFLPVSKSISARGFTADWWVPFIARGVRAEGESDLITGLDATALGVSFVELADPYQSVNRSLKYVPLFLGLLFLTFFTFEATTGKRVHPAQYILVGIAQIIF
jgi:inner membrane protein